MFVLDEKEQPKPVRIKLGLSDGLFAEVREGLDEGARVIIGQGTPRGPQSGPPGTQAGNPFQPQFQRRQR